MKFIKSKAFIVASSILVTILVLFCIFRFFDYTDNDNGKSSFENCNVLPINIRGDIQTYFSSDLYDDNGYLNVDGTSSEDIQATIMDIENYPNIKAILVVVDSYGGKAVAGEEISNLWKQSSKPVIALIRSAADSAAYYSISSSDYIFASEMSDIGSIGVTQSGLINVKKNEKEGLTFIELNTGKYKDILNPDKPVTVDELRYIKAQLQIVHDKFVTDVSRNRSIPIDKVKNMADGSSVLGKKAIELGLIDEIGDYYDATAYISKIIGESVQICK